MYDAIAELRQAGQALGDLLQERIAILHCQRRGGTHHDVKLAVARRRP
jgi:hypothetical protein